MPILDYSPDKNIMALLPGRRKPLPGLAPLHIQRSRLLPALYVGVAGLLWCLSAWNLWPHVYGSPYGILYGLLLLVMAIVLWRSWRRFAPLAGVLWFQPVSASPAIGASPEPPALSPWHFTPATQGDSPDMLTLELPEAPMGALVWPWVVILYWPALPHVRPATRLVVMCDALPREDFRRLKRWLLLCLHP